MKQKNNLPFKHIFFVGIGGISQSALAKICQSEGIKVSGSDKEKNEITEHLRHIGINVFIGHSAKNISKVDLLVYSGAIPKNNEEIVYAKSQNIKIMERAEFLGMLSFLYKNVIAISGIHGKTTTTAMIGLIFIKAQLNPTIHIGGEVKNFDSNVKIGDKNYFITEACEYRESFLRLKPDCSVILNIENDHPDYYKNLNEIFLAFEKFSNNSKTVVIGEKYKSLITKKDVITFGLNGNCEYKACNIQKTFQGTTFCVIKKGKFWGKVNLKIYGEHNVYNALSSIAISEIFNISKQDIIDGLNEFVGVKRRFDYWGENKKAVLIHDYAHHPTEVKATIKTCKDHFNLPVICFFQPHTYSRTKELFGDFLSAFDQADYTYIMPTYPARETPKQGFSGLYLQRHLLLKNKNTKYLKKLESVLRYIKKHNKEKCIILLLGAGDIYKIKNDIVDKK